MRSPVIPDPEMTELKRMTLLCLKNIVKPQSL